MTSLRDRAAVVTRPGPLLRTGRWHVIVFTVLVIVYAIYTLAVIEPSIVGRIDRYVYSIHFRRDVLTTAQYDFLLKYVYLGQRGVATFVVLPYFIWTALRLRSSRPLVMLVVALILLNLSVGAVKLGTGRLGPRETVHYFDVHMGGDIYPSGHVSNAVVLYGLIAWISLRHRRLFTGIAIWISVTVGLAAVMVNTHWFADIVGGWMAGGLVLLALPWFVPPAERLLDRFYMKRIKYRSDPWVARLEDRFPALRGVGGSKGAEGIEHIEVPRVSAERHPGELGGTRP